MTTVAADLQELTSHTLTNSPDNTFQVQDFK